MKAVEDSKLQDIELQDVEDTLGYIAKALELNLAYDAFSETKTFGDICQVFQDNIAYQNEESCTSQQAFYKIRSAIAVSQKIDGRSITPRTRLDEVFPRIGRRKKIKAFQKELGIPVNFLTMKIWLILLIIGGFITSLVAFFFNWKFALTGILTCLIFNWIAMKLRQEIEYISIGELTMKITRDHYMQVRRTPNTINRNEIVKIIQCTFMSDLDLKLSELHKDALLGKI